MSERADGRPAGDGDAPRERYRHAVAALATTLHDQVAGHDRTDQALVTGRREISDRLGESAGRVRDAQRAVAAATDDIDAVDRRVRRLWRELAALPGRRRDLGPMPAPRAVTARPERTATELLDRAERTVTAARLGELPLRPPVPVWLGTLVAGVVGALICAGIGMALLAAAPGMPAAERGAARVIADVAFAFGLLAGLPIALSWLSRYGQPMTAKAFGAVVGVGAAVTLVLFVLLGH